MPMNITHPAGTGIKRTRRKSAGKKPPRKSFLVQLSLLAGVFIVLLGGMVAAGFYMY